MALLLSTGPGVAAEVTVAALGDSLTQGFGLAADEGFVPQLSRWLKTQGASVKLINAGVSGDTTAGGLARIDWTLSDDIDGIIVALGGNDLLRGIDPASSRNNLDGILSRAKDRGVPILLIGMVAPPNYGADFKVQFDAMYADLATKHGTELHPNFMSALAKIGDRERVLELYMQADAIHPNAKGVALIVEDLGPSVLELIKLAREE